MSMAANEDYQPNPIRREGDLKQQRGNREAFAAALRESTPAALKAARASLQFTTINGTSALAGIAYPTTEPTTAKSVFK